MSFISNVQLNPSVIKVPLCFESSPYFYDVCVKGKSNNDKCRKCKYRK